MSKDKRPSPTTIRFPDDLKKKIHAERKIERRSFTAQVITILTKHYERKK